MTRDELVDRECPRRAHAHVARKRGGILWPPAVDPRNERGRLWGNVDLGAMPLVLPVAKNGHINHSVCLWCYSGMKSTDMAPVAKRLGLKAIDLLTPKDWGPLKENGLICSMTSGVWGGIEKGLKSLSLEKRPALAASGVEFILEGLHLSKRINKTELDGTAIYAG